MKALKTLIKPFEVPQISVKKEIKLIFSLCLGLGREGLGSGTFIFENSKSCDQTSPPVL